jgi:hypothetical protein
MDGHTHGAIEMMKLGLAALILQTGTSPAVPSYAPFECRRASPVAPSLPVIRTEEDKRVGYSSWWYDASSAKVLGLPATFLSYSITRGDDEQGFNEFSYTSVVRGKIDEVRWLVERANPDLRCVRIPANGISDGNSYSCLKLAGGPTENGRSVSVYPASGQDFLDALREGIVISCSFDDLKKK